ncbi:MAG: superoxide dismutase [Candidatus Blackburnbacteria bacterium RIFCSPHIGHO2_02_FULL_39_13]|uniref:Superoxide dismutase n=2 Tax=Patescibacteria group TaxID=1783273 RepID=A0A0G1D293_9BACT|nr:MAG: Superoxide dismutase [Candidatus Magasanikbacteria bacterium GW2011_GWA2_42_32]OGY07035.1 MAG: superoxide dismutase [Candidatus Blackburnbacteria bacterium RIFCSPHIGHO2_01_FULL_40_17]OGY08161.1 MAG: superoxide dismutase [Candidatus Blackburnbacteria bacterium RIFCSPHIGHO2_02_FULL_39_13]OGY13419.1 MAG: superoxide dismutase [Candidatus Blackburnbacteria bacterium RIFCSPLOWO2_01_FULL_40_20]OGY14685.1 MAG: superoxide dismutase [Candidatus Blackburnbacteria bacterium RIFCSPLOWO2_02_FULL_40_1
MFELPPLPYAYDTLEPYIDARTMEIHYAKHHQGYIDKLNTALKDYPGLQNKSIEELLSNLNEIPEKIRDQVRNQGGGHHNHSLFWKIMGHRKTATPTGSILTTVENSFGSFEEFKMKFTEVAINHFGSGWAWLVADSSNNLIIRSTSNQDSPISEKQKPILELDLWEHAYYLKYQNKRAEYIDAWWNVVNWEAVEQNMA